jgi:hypothetical protein
VGGLDDDSISAALFKYERDKSMTTDIIKQDKN